MDNLTHEFSRLATAEAEEAFLLNMSTANKNIRRLPPDPMSMTNLVMPKLNDTENSDLARLLEFLKSMGEMKPRHLPLDRLPCANVQVDKYSACEKQGTKACSACKLVSYCSQECQKTHWQVHKQDCKNPMKSEDWKPLWATENRLPSFITNENLKDEFRQKKMDEFSVGASLWGNTPAVDAINLADNEKDEKRNFSLAFIASGDLRHIMKTLNSLPSNYSGKLNILVNDLTLPVICRNLALLLILGTISDETIAADTALHFWYSAFMPVEYHYQISTALIPFLCPVRQDEPFAYPLGPQSNLSCCLPTQAKDYFLHFISPSASLGAAQDEYDRVRTAPSRRDFRDRMYANLKPSHRVAFQEFRRFGIILPFGAINAHFNWPNLSLFSLEGQWLQTDFADPLEGWDVGAVIAAGKAHGANPEDIYGCFYFFISEQLRMFAQRLRQFQIAFRITSVEACELSNGIRDNLFCPLGIPASIRFDRIEVSNILDVNYVGLNGVLNHWAPLLTESSTAVIFGYFMNWPLLQEGGRALEAGEAVRRRVLSRLMSRIKVNNHPRNLRDLQSLMYLLNDNMNALYENSKPFSTFLEKQGLNHVLRKTKLTLREKHTITPHRNGVPLQGSSKALPEFQNDESWYYYTKLSSSSWSERFVEFARLG